MKHKDATTQEFGHGHHPNRPRDVAHRRSAITGVIVGAWRPGQVLETLGTAALELDDELLRAIDQAPDEYGSCTVGLY